MTEAKSQSQKGAVKAFSSPAVLLQEANTSGRDLCPWRLHHNWQSQRHSAASSGWVISSLGWFLTALAFMILTFSRHSTNIFFCQEKESTSPPSPLSVFPERATALIRQLATSMVGFCMRKSSLDVSGWGAMGQHSADRLQHAQVINRQACSSHH